MASLEVACRKRRSGGRSLRAPPAPPEHVAIKAPSLYTCSDSLTSATLAHAARWASGSFTVVASRCSVRA